MTVGEGEAAAGSTGRQRIRWRPRARTNPAAIARWLSRSFETDIEAGCGFLWLPVALSLGIWAYFAAPGEPPPWLAPAVALVAAGVAVVVRRAPVVFVLAAAVSSIALGAAMAQWEVARSAAPVLARERTVAVEGYVLRAEPREAGRIRFVVAVTTFGEGGERRPPPARVMVTAAASRAPVGAGEGVRFLARLQPPRGPDLPAGYDPARSLYLQGIGASGFVLGAVEPVALPPPASRVMTWRLKAAEYLDDVRTAIAARIRAALPGPAGEIAVALLVGERGGIPREIEDDMRTSGLTHVLSISGLHMTLVAGTLIVALRAMLAAIPGLALRFPIKRWAAAAALPATAAYLALSGGDLATQRSFVMIAVALLAVIVERPAITLRSVAVGALVVLLIQPSAVLNPGFQMSFAAVIALVAAFGWWQRRRRPPDDDEAVPVSRVRRIAGALLLGAAGLAATSVIAGIASGPIAAYHFHRAAPLGLVANLIAMPAVSVVVMPMGVAAFALMPFGLEALPLTLMGFGIDFMTAVATRVAAWTGSAGDVGRLPFWTVMFMVAALLWGAIAEGAWRVLALVPLGMAIAAFLMFRPPDVLVTADGRAAALRQADGRLAIVAGRDGRRAVETWLSADGDVRLPRDPSLTGAARCDPLGCVIVATPPGAAEAVSLSVAASPAAIPDDCRHATILVASVTVAREDCASPRFVIDRRFLARTGAVTLTFPDGDPTVPPVVEAALPGGERPWTRHLRP